MKKTLFAALLTCILVSCAPNVTVNPQAIETSTGPSTLAPPPTFTPPPFIAFPNLPDLPPITVTPMQTPLPAVLPKFSWDGYVLTFIKDGDLYFQDGNNQPVKLTHVGEKSHLAIVSDDIRSFLVKAIFLKGIMIKNQLYSINTDGAGTGPHFKGMAIP
ncbi:hypothetical protein [Candidatus Villigracilis affinis]|uniref:hypothetical protein n=1 Tax=Candidatus Villigracilis affinis TaxID=3140682 RepID=UPI001DAFC1E4|nr:hypothetical protein [Anaerolineales bacterium]